MHGVAFWGAVTMNDPSAFIREAFDAAPVGMLVMDEAGVMADVNQQLERLFGHDRADLLGHHIDMLVPTEAGTPTVRQGEQLGLHRDGRRIPIEVGLTPLERASGKWLVASVVDLTERRRAEEQFRLAIEAAPNGMLLVDEAGTIVLINAQIDQIFGWARHELIGRSVDELLPPRARAAHGGERRSFFRDPRARPMGAGRELFGLHRDGREVPVEIGLSPLRTDRGTLVLCSIVDITERRQAREQLQASLAEKEMLLKELHHRAKNNLQLIGSLLDLAADRPGPQALAECRDRIHSIALVHEKLYQAGTFTRIELRDYLETLGEQVAHAWQRSPPVTLALDLEPVSLALDTAVPCGLIVNELLTNAFKHAFPEGRAGQVTVRAARRDGRVALEVTDDGVGLDPSRGATPGHIGLDLVRALARQLRAELHFEAAGGTRVRLTFDGGGS